MFGNKDATDAAFAKRQARGEAAGREQPALAGRHGAAGRDRRLRRRRRLLHALYRLAEPARRAHGNVARLSRAGEPASGWCRPTSAAASASRAARFPDDALVLWASRRIRRPVKWVATPLGKHADRPLRSRDGLLRRARARRARQDSGAARAMPVPARRLFRRRGAGRRRVLGALHPGRLRHPDHAHHVAGPVHQHLAVRALSRRRPSGGRLFHRAADRARGAHDRHRAGRDQAP